MQPDFYLDLEPRSTKGGLVLPLWVGQVMQVLHGAFRQQPGCYALALPCRQNPFLCLRVFAASREALDQLADLLAGKPALNLQVGRTNPVPAGYAGSWSSYRRYRIPTRKAERLPQGTLRQRRILEADAANLPFFQLRSASSGEHFGLRVKIVAGEANIQPCVPDSYGLAVSSRPFSLPDLPYESR